ncbi:hypothetical protein F4703DRAFT_1836934 [Phycomyces blakesleeanus]
MTSFSKCSIILILYFFSTHPLCANCTSLINNCNIYIGDTTKPYNLVDWYLNIKKSYYKVMYCCIFTTIIFFFLETNSQVFKNMTLSQINQRQKNFL